MPSRIHGEHREAPEGGGREGASVVGAYDARQAKFVEQAMEDRFRELDGGRTEALAREQIPAVTVDDRQRVAVPAVPRLELTLEICGPQIVGGNNRARRSSGMAWILPPPVTDHQAMALQDLATSAPARETRYPSLSEDGDQLLRTPVRVRS